MTLSFAQEPSLEQLPPPTKLLGTANIAQDVVRRIYFYEQLSVHRGCNKLPLGLVGAC